jgi:hypothetical protein
MRRALPGTAVERWVAPAAAEAALDHWLITVDGMRNAKDNAIPKSSGELLLGLRHSAIYSSCVVYLFQRGESKVAWVDRKCPPLLIALAPARTIVYDLAQAVRLVGLSPLCCSQGGRACFGGAGLVGGASHSGADAGRSSHSFSLSFSWPRFLRRNASPHRT